MLVVIKKYHIKIVLSSFFWGVVSFFCEKSGLPASLHYAATSPASLHYAVTRRRRLADNLAGKSADSSSVEYSRTLPRLRLDRPATLPHAGLYGCVRIGTDVYGECRVVCP